jgi:hypothetical protein
MRLVLSLAKAYHTPVSEWLDMTVVDLFDWSMVAREMIEEEIARSNVQKVGAGL